MIAPERYGSDRVIAFSDGVVAIAITLLLLPLAELELPGDGKVATLVSENWPLFGGLTLSWAIIALFWMAHHRLFDHIKVLDRTLMRLNFLWLFAIALMPLPTNIVIENPPSAQVVGFYIGWMTLISFLMMCTLLHARRKPGILDPEYVESLPAKAAQYRTYLVTGVFAGCTLSAIVVPQYALYLLLLQIPVDRVAEGWARRSLQNA